MTLKLFNTLTRKKEIFKPINENEVKMYECGPTVYSHQHIGNLFRYIFGDILTRVILFNNYELTRVMNVTDVGHLTGDSDDGKDKIEEAAKKQGKKATDIANHYLEIFKQDFKKLNITEPNIWCKVTDHINEQIELIKKLEDKGYTYKTTDGIYFDTSKFKDYGKLVRLKKQGIEAGKRITLKEKKNHTDFALWKFSKESGKRQQEWDSPWGLGFPGWHIECSAMSMKYLGETMDIHTGGIDNMFPHHENEIAQSESATEKKFVNYWLHNAYLTSKGEKISKSKGGLYTISELQKKGFDPLAFRYLCLQGHYRKNLNFDLESLESAQISLKRLKNIIKKIKEDDKINKDYLEKFKKEINDDLNMPRALAVLWTLLRDENAKGKYQTIKKMDEVLGLNLFEEEKIEIPEEIKNLAEERLIARKNKDWNESDKLRNELLKKGWKIIDLKQGYELERV